MYLINKPIMNRLLFLALFSLLLFCSGCKTQDDFIAIDAKYEFLNHYCPTKIVKGFDRMVAGRVFDDKIELFRK
jgi:hypothetical protein